MTIATVPAISEADARIERRLCELATYDSASIWEAQDELSSAIAEAGMHFEGRAYPVCLRPLAIDCGLANHLTATAEAVIKLLDVAAELYCCNEDVQDLFPAYKHLRHWITILPKHRPIVRICRLDGLFGSDGYYKIIETNTEAPGGVIQNGLAAKVWSRIPNPLTHGLSLDVSKQPFAKDPTCFVRELVSAYHSAAGSELKTAAVVNFRGRYANEVDWIVNGLRDAGVKATLLDVSTMKLTPRGLVGPDGELIELVYNKLDPRDVIEACEAEDYLRACAAQEVVSINPWVSQCVLSDKAILALLSDDRFSSNFNAEQISLIARHVPWTRLVREGVTTDPNRRRIELISYIRKNKTDLVLKPSNATRGEHVLVGRLTSSEAWEEHIDRAARNPYVVQEYIAPGEVTALHPPSRSFKKMAYGIDCYVFGGRLAGFQSRASLDPVMNVGRSGILLPIAID
ncbi:glutathionylspermidine synthase family protein [Mesorhizobium delmotii]|uniref:Similarities with diaminobutyric acid aminotransferase n=1 Tax=Mesorhizobium delmotii TaxID=1631247 RepID=A0A2P9AUN2_9HYPH|nr:glutathionylspermidine synthase family protein [Mesorhizobium delmotii]SJM34836.1 Similarities with diaminobutyric acid aminotransferase [Mesorhizobium delmotii]